MNINYSIVLDNITAPILVLRPVKDVSERITDFDIIYKNEEAKKAVGYIIKDSTKWSDFGSELSAEIPWFKMALDAIAGRFYPESKFFSPATEFWYKVDMKYLPEEKYVIILFSNITSERHYYQKLKQSLTTDALTGFLNRTSFRDTLSLTIETSKYQKKATALLLIDIDNLQNINDSLGVKEGDSLIVQVAEVLKQFMREHIQVFRYGDDEFAVIVSNFDSENTLVNFIDCIYEAFQIKQIGVSGGVAFFPNHTE